MNINPLTHFADMVAMSHSSEEASDQGTRSCCWRDLCLEVHGKLF
jgi:hypothetical protein